MATIKQKSVVVDIEGFKKIEVRRMKWKPASQFLAQLGEAIAEFYRARKVTPDAQNLAGIIDQIPTLIGKSSELAWHLVHNSTDLTAEEFDGLDILAASEVLKESIGLNCDVELKNCWAGIVAALVPLMPAKTQTS